jgi:hypothetical protein
MLAPPQDRLDVARREFTANDATRLVREGRPPTTDPATGIESFMPTTETFNDHVVRRFLLASAVWGIIGMRVGM